jgi:hypothetical protein
MDVIAKDLREAHKKDFDTAPETDVADDLRKSIADAASFPGSVKEKKVRLFAISLVWTMISWNRTSLQP